MGKYNWTDYQESRYGMAVDRPVPKGKLSGDALIVTAMQVIAQKAVGEFTEADRLRIINILKKCVYPGRRGLVIRNPRKRREQVSHDAIQAYVYLCVAVGAIRLPRDCYKYGRDHEWFYDNSKLHPFPPNFRSYMGPLRFPQVSCHIKIGTRYRKYGRTSRLELIGWKKSQKLSLRDYNKNVEAATHFALRNEVAKLSTVKEFRDMARYFDKRFRIKGGLGKRLARWGKHWRDSPTCRALIDARK